MARMARVYCIRVARDEDSRVMKTERTFWQAFGPGVLFAGAAVGVSHLVQSTRSGAELGFALLLVIVFANVAKYPAFRFGPHYAAATGTSLLEGYRRQGMWALILYAIVTAGTMFTVQAAVTFVTAALVKALFRVDYSLPAISAGLTALCVVVIAIGRYRWLDIVSKGVVALLTVSTVVATVLALGKVDWGSVPLLPDGDTFSAGRIVLVAGLIGWMPSAIDVAVWQSLWTLARARDTGHKPSLRESMLDFHIGYVGTAALALCFLALGAGVMYGSGAQFSPAGAVFANQVIDLYTATLGDWSRPIIGVAACSVMFSTTLTVVDGFPRALSVLVARFRGAEEPGGAEQDRRDNMIVYWGALAVLAGGTMVLLFSFIENLVQLVDVATILSFLTAPVLAWLNHRCIQSDEVPADARPGPRLIAMSWIGIAFLGGFAAYFLYLRFGG
jgi:Mn2+/Fe2+ NRAMP family transporter